MTTPVWKLSLPLTKIAPVTSIALMVAARKTILYRTPVGSVAILAHALGLGMYDAKVALMVIAGDALLIVSHLTCPMGTETVVGYILEK